MAPGTEGRARLAIVLHAHIPRVRIHGMRFPLQELWLYQSMLECYIPLLRMLERLRADAVPVTLTLSVSPPLLSMLADDYYSKKFDDYLTVLGELLEGVRTRLGRDAARAVDSIAARIGEARSWKERHGSDLARAVARLDGEGIELVTSSATHAYLPAWRHAPGLVKLQVEAGLRCFREITGVSPTGFWLPEMGYYSGLDRVLADAGIEYTFLSAHSLYTTPTVPPTGNFFPAVTGAGLRVFPRDAGLSDQVWSRSAGYPGDERYREFHFDCSWDLPDEERIARGVPRGLFGLKIFRITGGDRPKEYYDPEAASEAVREHVDAFMGAVRDRAREVRGLTGVDPVFTLPFDLELFGHWWFEGTDFLEGVFREAARSGDLALAAPGDFADTAGLPLVVPAESSWGRGGYGSTWLNPRVMDIYRKVSGLYARFRGMAHGVDGAHLYAGMWELLLAQSSDWSFGIDQESFSEYFMGRIEDHLGAAERIAGMLEQGMDDADFSERRLAALGGLARPRGAACWPYAEF